MSKCMICGRTEEELEGEFGREVTVIEHQGMDKCQKCVREYQRETGEEDQSREEPVKEDTKEWKEALTA